MALNPCVKAVLCGLASATRNALAGIIRGYVSELTAQKKVLEAKLVYLNILNAPVAIANKVAQEAISEVKAGANLIPLSLIGSCIQVGDLSTSIQQNLDIIAADANIVANDLQRLLSFGDELQAAIDELTATIQFYTDIIATIDVCPPG